MVATPVPIPLTERKGGEAVAPHQAAPGRDADEGANRNDHLLARPTLESIPIERPEPTNERPQGLCLDAAYDNNEVRELAREFGFTAHIRSRGEEKKALTQEAGFRARRWVVERTHSWLNRYRAILIRWSKKPENHLLLPPTSPARSSPGKRQSQNLYRDRF